MGLEGLMTRRKRLFIYPERVMVSSGRSPWRFILIRSSSPVQECISPSASFRPNSEIDIVFSYPFCHKIESSSHDSLTNLSGHSIFKRFVRRSGFQFFLQGTIQFIRCSCGEKAKWVCPICLVKIDENSYFCDECAKEHECGEDMLLPVVNSPRCGVLNASSIVRLNLFSWSFSSSSRDISGSIKITPATLHI